MLEIKECVRCRRTLPVSEFEPNRRTVDGLQVYCKDCEIEMEIKASKKREAKANLYVSRQAISDSLNNKRKTNIACGKYIFKYEYDLYKSKVMI